MLASYSSSTHPIFITLQHLAGRMRRIYEIGGHNMLKQMIVWLGVGLLLVLTGCFVLSEPEASSGAVVAPTLAAAVEEPVVAEEPVVEEAETAVSAEPTAVVEEVVVATEAVEEETAVSAPQQSADTPIYELDPAQSEARFIINEVLRGTPTTVVGKTSNVAGQIAFAANDPASTRVGQIVIGARDLATDNNFRNRAIANEILHTNQFEFITFTPTSITGLPDSVAVGESYSFQMVGDLTITDQTQEVVFETTATLVDAATLQGEASTTLAYADFGVTVPFAQSVDAVEETVTLELSFVAPATGPVEAAVSEVVAEGGEDVEAAGETAVSVEPIANDKINLNQMTNEQLLATIPNFGSRMVREFFEYQPYVSIQQFRREIGKYVDDAQVAAYETYVYVPVSVDDSDAETLKQIPGVDDSLAAALMAARPFGSNDAFLAKLTELAPAIDPGIAASYLTSG